MTIASGTAGALSVWMKCRQPLNAPAPVAIVLSRIDMMLGANGRRDDVGFVYVGARERLNHSPPREHDDLVA